MTRTITLATSVIVLGFRPSFAEIQFVTGPQTIACPTPFLKDARAAVQVGDATWLKETECVVTSAGLAMSVISGHNVDRVDRSGWYSETWRVRIHPSNGGEGVTAYIEGWTADYSPSTLNSPAKILFGTGNYGGTFFSSREQALQKWSHIAKENPSALDGLHAEIEPLAGADRNFWLFGVGLSFGEATKRCSKNYVLFNECQVMEN